MKGPATFFSTGIRHVMPNIKLRKQIRNIELSFCIAKGNGNMIRDLENHFLSDLWCEECVVMSECKRG